jgi:hypothetical protein
MKTSFFLLLHIILVNTNHLKAQEIKHNVLFRPGQTQLTDKQKKDFLDFSKTLNDGKRVIVFPLTYDSIFDHLTYARSAKNQAEKLAEYAKTIGFELLGIPGNFPSAYRGVSVSVNMKYTKPQESLSDETVPEPVSTSLKNHYPEKPSQYFVIDPNRDTVIIGNEGTRLFFESGSLMSAKKVQIELKEFYSLGDYMKNALPTISNGKMILTGGSIYLNAIENNSSKKRVNINQDKGVAAEFKLGKDDPDMQIFVKDSRSGKVNWVLPVKPSQKEDWEMTEVLLDEKRNIIWEKKYTSKEAWEKHLKEEEQIAIEEKKQEKEAREKAAASILTRNNMNEKLKIYNLGYINCDKFPNEPMTPYTITADEKMSNAEYYLIYSDIRGVMTGYTINKVVSFGSVPIGRGATLIAVSFIGKQAYYFKSAIRIDGKPVPKISLKPVDESFLNQELASLK